MNLSLTEELRHEATHLVIDQLPSDVMELLQSNVLNYHDKLKEWFGRSLHDQVSVGMMWLVFDISSGRKDPGVLTPDLGVNEVLYLTELQAQIGKQAEILGYSQKFVATIELQGWAGEQG